jgi:L-aspartate oxidase
VPRADLQRAMSRHASVVRDHDGLQTLTGLLDAAPRRTLRGRADVEDAALTLTAQAVVTAALQRTESRGCHHRADHPDADPAQAVSTALAVDAAGGVKVRAGACC